MRGISSICVSFPDSCANPSVSRHFSLTCLQVQLCKGPCRPTDRASAAQHSSFVAVAKHLASTPHAAAAAFIC